MGRKSRNQNHLRRGDRKVIAEKTRYSESYVKKVLAGERKNKKITDVAEKLSEINREVEGERIKLLQLLSI